MSNKQSESVKITKQLVQTLKMFPLRTRITKSNQTAKNIVKCFQTKIIICETFLGLTSVLLVVALKGQIATLTKRMEI